MRNILFFIFSCHFTLNAVQPNGMYEKVDYTNVIESNSQQRNTHKKNIQKNYNVINTNNNDETQENNDINYNIKNEINTSEIENNTDKSIHMNKDQNIKNHENINTQTEIINMPNDDLSDLKNKFNNSNEKQYDIKPFSRKPIVYITDEELNSTLKFLDSKPYVPNDICEKYIHKAENEYKLPKNILLSIAYTESGKKHNDKFIAWPWTINTRGKGMFFKTKKDMLNKIYQLFNKGERNIDIGCMQINLHYHFKKNFKSLEDMADPCTNVNYAAKLLLSLKQQYKSWVKAIKYYHSFHEKHNKRYCQAVKCRWIEIKKQNQQNNLRKIESTRKTDTKNENAKNIIKQNTIKTHKEDINLKCKLLHTKAMDNIKKSQKKEINNIAKSHTSELDNISQNHTALLSAMRLTNDCAFL